MEATFWRNQFSYSLILNNWLLRVTTFGYYLYYPTTTSTISAISYAHMGGTRQDGETQKKWEFYTLRIRFPCPIPIFSPIWYRAICHNYAQASQNMQ